MAEYQLSGVGPDAFVNWPTFQICCLALTLVRLLTCGPCVLEAGGLFCSKFDNASMASFEAHATFCAEPRACMVLITYMSAYLAA